jgi:hypothetical protein
MRHQVMLNETTKSVRHVKAREVFSRQHTLPSQVYSHLQNRLRPFSPKKILSTDHIATFALSRFVILLYSAFSTLDATALFQTWNSIWSVVNE